jgi:hypothetical protein
MIGEGKIYLQVKAYAEAKKIFQRVLSKEQGNSEAKRLLIAADAGL